MTQAPTQTSRWLYGPVADLMLGCGLLYALVSVVFLLDGGAVFRSVPIMVPALLIALVSAPHYGATLMRVYDRREDRRGYFLFSVVATLALAAVFAVALFDRWTGSVLATVYLTWAGWHYTGQNYGIAAMFLRRRGVKLEGRSRSLLHGSFVLSYALVFLVMHSQAAPVADPGDEVRLIPLAIPKSLNDVVIPLTGAAYLGTTAAWTFMLARESRRLSDLGPTLLISVTQALWWSIPYCARFFDFGGGWVPLDWDSRSAFFPWIAGAHALQYLWITSFYARSSSGWHGQARYYLTVLTAGSAIWALPALVFAPGKGAFDWNFALLLAAAVNIHHFILDGAIWKLRHMKIARVLISNASSETEDRQSGGGLRKLVWGIAVLGLVVTVYSLTEEYLIESAARRARDLEGVARSLDRQAWLGKTSAFEHFKLGRQFELAGKPDEATAQFEISAGMKPRVESIKRLIGHYQRSGDAAGFVRSCDRLFALDGVDRPPIEVPALEDLAQGVPDDFAAACVRVARAARPAAPRGDPTGGAGLDGNARGRAGYD